MNYTAPTPDDLRNLRDELGKTQAEMADFVNVAGGQQWRKYTGGANPRQMSFHLLFFTAARLELDADQFGRVLERMRELGAGVDLSE